MPSLNCLPLPLICAAEPRDDAGERLARRGVEGVEELVEVDGGGRRVLLDHAAVGDLLAALGRHAQVDVAVGDARQRGLADRGERAAAQRRVVVLELHRDLGLAVRREVDVLDGADRRAARLDEVALHQLGGVLEARLDLVVAAGGAQQEDRDHDGHDKNGGQGRRANDLIPRETHSQFPRTLERSAAGELAVIRDGRHTANRWTPHGRVPGNAGNRRPGAMHLTQAQRWRAGRLSRRAERASPAAAGRLRRSQQRARAGAGAAALDLHLAAAELAGLLGVGGREQAPPSVAALGAADGPQSHGADGFH